MNPLDLVRLPPLMDRSCGREEIVVGLIDGPVSIDHPDLTSEHLQEISGKARGACRMANSKACLHGTFVAGILNAKRGSRAPAICPQCTLLVRPIFNEIAPGNGDMPWASPQELATAIFECIEAGTRVINLSAALVQTSEKSERELEEALDAAASREVILIAATGNQASVGSTCISRHPWVIPVAACDLQGRPLDVSNFGNSIGKRGLSAPGDRITSLGAGGGSLTLSGTSAAAPFVTGAAALLFSEFPSAHAADVKLALSRAQARRDRIVPPLLDAWQAFLSLATLSERG